MAAQPNFTYRVDSHRIVCGRESIASLREEVERVGAERAMIICGPNILKNSDVVSRVQTALGDQYVGIFSGVEPHVPLETIAPAVEKAREVKADVLISVGGGSTHDTSRCIAVLLAEGGDLRDHGGKFEPSHTPIIPRHFRPKLPMIAVATTLGSAEFGGSSSGSGGFSDKASGRYVQLSDPSAGPMVIVIDGLALATTPVSILVSTGIGQLRIAIETVYSREHNPISDVLCLEGIKRLKKLLPQCADRNVDLLLQAKTAASLPVLGKVGKGLNTAMGHQIGGMYDVDHGLANAIPLPHTMRFNLEACAERQAMIAQALGIDISKLSDTEAGLAAADEVAALTRTLNLPARLRDVGVPEDRLEAIAKATMHDKHIPNNPKPITSYEQVLEVLRLAW